MVLCSATDKFVLSQDICVMCGALGTDQEGCLIACAQCGQCYHPYCVNVKVGSGFDHYFKNNVFYILLLVGVDK